MTSSSYSRRLAAVSGTTVTVLGALTRQKVPVALANRVERRRQRRATQVDRQGSEGSVHHVFNVAGRRSWDRPCMVLAGYRRLQAGHRGQRRTGAGELFLPTPDARDIDGPLRAS